MELVDPEHPPLTRDGRPIECFGYYRVVKNDLHQAVLITRGFVFKEGPVKQTYPEGAVLVRCGDKVWGVGAERIPGNWAVKEGNSERLIESLEAFGRV